jgi:hypothetical protein
MTIVTPQDVAYFEALVGRYARGANTMALNFPATQEGKCHENADAFFRCHPDHPAVRGWLVTELGNAPGYFRLVAHSVNRAPDGTLVDVTPLSDTDRKAYRFVEHDGSDGRFNELKATFAELYFPIIDALAISESNGARW